MRKISLPVIRIFYTAVLLCVCSHVSAQSTPPEYDSTVDYGLQPPVLITQPSPYYDYDKLDYGMTIGIDRTPKGRLWACWVAGGDSDEAFFVLNSSDDNGKTWSKPRLVIDPHNPALPKNRRALVGTIWVDPSGKLWVFFDQSMGMFDGRAGDWYTTCDNPDSDEPKWSAPVRIWHGCTLNKPTVLSNGHWLLPVSLWPKGSISDKTRPFYPELDSLRMANVLVSTDQGKTWSRKGGIKFPDSRFDEHMIVERKDGSLWMTARTSGAGIWRSVSTDGGATWSTPEKFMDNISARHFVRRLQSGNILLVKYGGINETTKHRSKLTAFLSDDEGITWKGGLVLDERRSVSYPDGTQAPDGTIYVSYDRNRATDGEILLAKFKEADIMKGSFTEKGSAGKILISKPLGLDKQPAPSLLIYQQKNR